MAVNKRGNLVYLESGDAGENLDKIRKLIRLIITPTAANAICVLKDRATGGNANIMDLRAATSGESKIFDFSEEPLVYPNGLEVDTLTNCTVMLQFREQ